MAICSPTWPNKPSKEKLIQAIMAIANCAEGYEDTDRDAMGNSCAGQEDEEVEQSLTGAIANRGEEYEDTAGDAMENSCAGQEDEPVDPSLLTGKTVEDEPVAPVLLEKDSNPTGETAENENQSKPSGLNEGNDSSSSNKKSPPEASNVYTTPAKKRGTHDVPKTSGLNEGNDSSSSNKKSPPEASNRYTTPAKNRGTHDVPKTPKERKEMLCEIQGDIEKLASDVKLKRQHQKEESSEMRLKIDQFRLLAETIDNGDKRLGTLKAEVEALEETLQSNKRKRDNVRDAIKTSNMAELDKALKKAKIDLNSRIEEGNKATLKLFENIDDSETEEDAGFAKYHQGFVPATNRDTAMKRGKEMIRLADNASNTDGSENLKFTKDYFVRNHKRRFDRVEKTLNALCEESATGTFIVLLQGKTNEQERTEEQEIELIMWQPATGVFTAMTPADANPSVWKPPAVLFQNIVLNKKVNLLEDLLTNLNIPGNADEKSVLCYKTVDHN